MYHFLYSSIVIIEALATDEMRNSQLFGLLRKMKMKRTKGKNTNVFMFSCSLNEMYMYKRTYNLHEEIPVSLVIHQRGS